MFKPLTKKIIACTLAANSTPATAQTPTPQPETTYSYAKYLPDRDNDGFPDEWEEHGFTDEHGGEHPIHLWGTPRHRTTGRPHASVLEGTATEENTPSHRTGTTSISSLLPWKTSSQP